jgi:thiamine pyrophosphokinase
MYSDTVILADGDFPDHEIPLGYLKSASRIICCDGSANTLVQAGYTPYAIVGDMDSLGSDLLDRFADRIFADFSQDTNDLTKAVTWCTGKGYRDLVILGGTGKREDHTVGNISLLAEYVKNADVKMVTDTGIFLPFINSSYVKSFPGQQISLFSIDPNTEITSSGLKYQLTHYKIRNWWVATLNEALGDNFHLEISGGPVIVFLAFVK